jgi:transcriptional regulator with XRE-family HTH domain
MAAARNRRGLRQPQVAEMMHTNQARVSRWETAEHRISAPEFITWAEKMDLSHDEWCEFRELGCLTESELEDQRRKRSGEAA